MSNLANYSPFKRSYQFMHLQNTVYHLKNKRKAKPLVKTNLNLKSRYSLSEKKQTSTQTGHKHNNNPYRSRSNSINLSFKKNDSQVQPQFKHPYRVIHKNQIVERAKSAKIFQENSKIVSKLINVQCMVTSRQNGEQFYKKQSKYRNLRRRYNENGQRLMISYGNLKLLNPSLADYVSNSTSNKNFNYRQNDYY